MSELNQIDYKPLDGMHHATLHVFKTSLKTPIGIGAFSLLIVFVSLSFVAASPNLLIAVLIVYTIYISYLSVTYRNNLWQSFAAANGWQVDTTTSILESVPPSMQFGHGPDFSPVIQARLGEVSCDLFSYNTTVGGGRYQHTYYYTMARVSLPVPLPHMLLLNKKAGAELQRDMANRQDIQLEGDFNDYFKLQIEQGQQIGALSVITPDVMQTLVQYNQAEDIEILANDLYFIMGLDKRDPGRIRHLIESVAALSQQIIANITHEQPPQPAVQTQPQPQTSAQPSS